MNETTKVMILMNSGVNIVFSGKFMAHHQQCKRHVNDEIFFNFSSYGNKKLFTHLKQTIRRIKSRKSRHRE